MLWLRKRGKAEEEPSEDPPEMNPMEQIWRELRTQGFRNEIFQTLEKVDDRLCDTIRELSPETIKSICGKQWIVECF